MELFITAIVGGVVLGVLLALGLWFLRWTARRAGVAEGDLAGMEEPEGTEGAKEVEAWHRVDKDGSREDVERLPARRWEWGGRR